MADEEEGSSGYAEKHVTFSFYWRILALYSGLVVGMFYLLYDAAKDQQRDNMAEHNSIRSEIKRVDDRLTVSNQEAAELKGKVVSELEHANTELGDMRRTLNDANNEIQRQIGARKP